MTPGLEIDPRRWEHGSDFPWPVLPGSGADSVPAGLWPAAAHWLGSGRDALRFLLRLGRAERGWRRLWIPSYFCQDVVASLAAGGLDLKPYPDNPLAEAIDVGRIPVRDGDAVLLVNYFGLRTRDDVRGTLAGKADVVEDHTHDPWSAWAAGSAAEFCIASLRKTLPVPEGGIIWSPRGLSLGDPPAPTEIQDRIAAEKLQAMFLKALYLWGYPVEKDAYRELFMRSEEAIGRGAVSAMTRITKTLLDGLPIDLWRRRRKDNHRDLSRRLETIPWLTVLRPRSDAACPFSCVLVFDSPERRSFVRERLIRGAVYPAVLWSLESPVFPGSASAEDLSLSRRMLSLHCDFRYGPEDLTRVSEALIAAGSAWRPGKG